MHSREIKLKAAMFHQSLKSRHRLLHILGARVGFHAFVGFYQRFNRVVPTWGLSSNPLDVC